MKVNFVDLKTQYLSIKDEIDTAIQNVLNDTAFVAGKYVKEFEENFAKLHEAEYCIGVNSGTSALHAVLMALNVGVGDEIIVPTNTFFATAEAVSLTGATPVFVDCDECCNIDPKGIEGAITKNTVGVIAVHLYGRAANLAEIKTITDANKLFLIEDCAQAHLTKYDGVPVGTFGVCGCFSFYPGKNLGAYGEGGAVITNSEFLYNRIMMIRDHGSKEKYHHDIVGHNYRLEGLQGAILNVKLKYIEEWTSRRIANGKYYSEGLKDIPEVKLIPESEHGESVNHLFVIRIKERDELAKFLLDKGIYTGIHYPIPCHKQRAYLPHNTVPLLRAEKYAKEILSLPMFPELNKEQMDYVISSIKEFYNK